MAAKKAAKADANVLKPISNHTGLCTSGGNCKRDELIAS